MPGTRITDQQVRLYMNLRKKKSQALAAVKAGMSERSARRLDHSVTLPSQTPRRYWRSLDLLRKWHTKIEAWILEQAGIEQRHQGEAAPGLRVVGG